MNVKYLVLSFISFSFFLPSLFAQLKNNDILVGISGAYEADNKVGITSFNFEYEKFNFNSALLGIGASANYCNFTRESDKNFFFTLHAYLNFTNFTGSKFIPFVGLSGGANLTLKDILYGANAGCRYFINNNILIFAKYGLTNRSIASPDIGIDFRF
jgi:hypothetical protein